MVVLALGHSRALCACVDITPSLLSTNLGSIWLVYKQHRYSCDRLFGMQTIGEPSIQAKPRAEVGLGYRKHVQRRKEAQRGAYGVEVG